MTKERYLESKALEVAALVLEHERQVQQGKKSLYNLKPDYLDRIHRAREILLQNLHQPPSLMELAAILIMKFQLLLSVRSNSKALIIKERR